MLAGCSSTLLSPRHRLRSEASAQFQACHIPAMSTQRLDLPCSFGRKEASRRQLVRQVGISVDKGIESKSSLRQNIKLPPVAAERRGEFWGRSKKRYAATDEGSNYMSRVKKRKSGNGKSEEESGEERDERGFFDLPPLPPLSNVPWFDSVVTEVTDSGMSKDVHPHREVSASGSSSTSSGSHSLALGLGSSNPTVEREAVGNGSSSRNPSEAPRTLLQPAIALLGSASLPPHEVPLYIASSPTSTEALALRVARLWPQLFHITPPRELEHVDDDALRVLNQVSPITKFVHFTCNEILLRALEGKDRVHIIDFDIKQGLQWPSLFQSLASRASPPSHVRITGIGESKQELMETGDRLAGFAEAFNLPFQFHPVVDRLEDVRLWMLHVKEKETVVANSVFQLHKMLYEGSALREFLGLIRSSNAQVVVMAEQEAAHNEATFDARLFNSLKYYSAVVRGDKRFERHEKFDKWQQLMEQGGFRCVGVSERELLQGQMMLKMYSSNHNYRVEVQQGSSSSSSLTLNWSDQPLYAVSAWAPVNGGGGSSSSLPR
ncbi:hypothetical protein SASPL_140750 [Salvia splendens]|uniref:DELLA protein n=1 Tax=Salvia splendens TaxID=180675 RepID=A0A8X8WR97_SALSN|nr:hypothetical protein SASPL_140750 [Salvia splendens]